MDIGTFLSTIYMFLSTLKSVLCTNFAATKLLVQYQTSKNKTFMKHYLLKSLLVLFGGFFMTAAAWADTTIGATDKGWAVAGSYTWF